MMDIVERLREKIKSLEWLTKMGGSDKNVLVVMNDAADEIERLREALVKIANDDEGDYDFLVFIARTALKGGE